MIRPLIMLVAIFAAMFVLRLVYMAGKRIGFQWAVTLLFVFALMGAMLLFHGARSRPTIIGWDTRALAPVPLAIVPLPPPLDGIAPADQARLEYEVTYAHVGDGSTRVVESREAHEDVVSAYAGPNESVVIRPRRGLPWYAPAGKKGGLVWTVILGGAITVFLYLAYLFLDAGTRGHFTWQLRIISILAFVGICVAIAALRGGL